MLSSSVVISHLSNKVGTKSDDFLKSQLKIMHIFNVTIRCGINNLWRQISARRSWTFLSIALMICLLLLVSPTEARPAAAVTRSIRDHSRHFFITSSTAGSYVAQKSSSTDASGAGDTLSLSIFSPLDVLRQNMLLEIQRKRIRHAKHRQMQSNKEFLDRIGR